MEALLSSHSSFEVKIKDPTDVKKMGESLKIFQINAFDLRTNLSMNKNKKAVDVQSKPESHFRSNQIVKFKPKLNRKS